MVLAAPPPPVLMYLPSPPGERARPQARNRDTQTQPVSPTQLPTGAQGQVQDTVEADPSATTGLDSGINCVLALHPPSLKDPR